MTIINAQLVNFKKSMSKKAEKAEGGDGVKKQVEPKESSHKTTNSSPLPLDENAIQERITKAGQVFKKFSSLLTKKQEVLL